MKKRIALGVGFAIASAAVSVFALDNNTMLGADSLRPFTLRVLSSAVCPAAVGISYTGGGSLLGEKALLTATQTVAPMSRFLQSLACSATDPSKAEGIAFAADGISIVASRVHRSNCDAGSVSPGIPCTAVGASGMRNSGTLVTGYQFGSASVPAWADVLRIVFMGLPKTAVNPDGSTPAGRSLRDCQSAERFALVENWGDLFETGCAGTGGNCTRLNHTFRPDSYSGTADIFRELIGAKAFLFCNERFAGDTGPVDYPTVLANGTPVFEEMYQDFDPMRRTCVGGQAGGGAYLPNPLNDPSGNQIQPDFASAVAEQVCSPKGTLGIVLPIRSPFFPGQSETEAFPTKPCLRGHFVLGPAPKVPGTSKSTLCPNGDITLGNSAADYNPSNGQIGNSSNICLVPAAADNDLRCINGKNNFTTPIDPPLGTIPANLRDGRVYNLHVYTAGGGYRSDSQLGAVRNVVGAFSRLHMTRTMLAAAPVCPGVAGSGRCCNQLDSTQQIGCLVQADPCSLGLASGEANQFQLQTSAPAAEGAFGLTVGGFPNSSECITSGQYPLARKMYINTLVGFEHVTGQELELTKCFSGSAVGFNTQLAVSGLHPLPAGPACRDFPQEACAGGAPASNACASNPTGLPIQVETPCAGVGTDDGNPCTVDSCNPNTQTAVHAPAPGSVCALASCAGGVQTSAGLCDSVANCKAGTSSSCGLFSCGPTSCNVRCESNTNCVNHAFCAADHSCQLQLGSGQTCSVSNQCQGGACVDGSCCDPHSGFDSLAGISFDPSSPTDFVEQVAPLYTGGAASQLLGSANAVDPRRVAVIRGQVLDELGTGGVPCVKVSVVGSPELGATRTRADGGYTIAVNAGSVVTLRFDLSGFLASFRELDTRWHQQYSAAPVRLIPFGPATEIATDSSGATLGPTVVGGDTETDANGQRTAKIFFPTGTKATVEGESSPRVNFEVQVKEMTNLSKTGRDGMVAPLPEPSAFTYAVNISLKAAENKPINLSQPVPVYVDNFLGMPNGETVPVGYYDTQVAHWIASGNGRVIRVLGTAGNGEALLDLNSAPGAESATSSDMLALGISAEERVELGKLPAQTSLWRFRTSHFSTWDANWGWGPPVPPPNVPPPRPRDPLCPGSAVGSIIDCQAQGLREKLTIAGTPYRLFYTSTRQFSGIPPLRIPLTGGSVSSLIKRVELKIEVGGKQFSHTLLRPIPTNFVFEFHWDGRDAADRQLYGAQPLSVRIDNVADGEYYGTSGFGATGNGTTVGAASARFEASARQDWTGTIDHWDAQQSGLGGWDFDVHHGYDPTSGTLHRGDGTDERVPGSLMVYKTVDGSIDALRSDGAIASGPDGLIYYSERGDAPSIIQRINTDGTKTKIAGGGAASTFPYGDGGLATAARLNRPKCMTVSKDQKLYICEWSTPNRIRVVDLRETQPKINQFATLPNAPEAIAAGDDGTIYVIDGGEIHRIRDGVTTQIYSNPASPPRALAVAKNGDIYFDVSTFFNMIVKRNTAGQVTNVTQGGLTGCSDGPAATSCLGAPVSTLTFGPDGLLYIGGSTTYKVKRISASGYIETVLGTGVQGSGPEGLPGQRTATGSIGGVAVTPEGILYAIDSGLGQGARIRASTFVASKSLPAVVPSSDGTEVYTFDAEGHHTETHDAHTGILRYAFRYNDAGYLIGISDRPLDDISRHETTISRDTSNAATSINAPFAHTTLLKVGTSTRLLDSVKDPSNGITEFAYHSTSKLLSGMRTPVGTATNGPSYAFGFVDGLLTSDTDPNGNTQTLSATNIANGWRVTHFDQLSRPTQYDSQSLNEGLTLSNRTTVPGDLTTETFSSLDGRKTDLGPDGLRYSAHQVNPDGSSVYSLSDSDPVLGLRAPVVSSRAEFMGSGTGMLKRYTSESREATLFNPSDPTSIATYTETRTTNGRPYTTVYDANERKFTTTSAAGRHTYRYIDTHGRTTSFQVGSLRPTTYTFDDDPGGTGLVKVAERSDPAITLRSAFSYYPVVPTMGGYLSGVSHSRNASVAQSTSYSTDDFGRVTLSTTGSDTTNLGWDLDGNLSTVVPPGAAQHEQKFTALNQLKEYIAPVLQSGQPPLTTQFTYTEDRQPWTTTFPGGDLVTNDYDPLTGKLAFGFDGSTGSSVGFEYFSNLENATGQAPGRMKAANAVRGGYGTNLSFTYLNRLLASSSWSGAVTGSVGWGYDNDFDVISETITDGTGASAAIKFGYSDLDRYLTCASLDSCSPAANALAVTHNANGLLSSVNFGNLIESYQYDSFGQLASKTANLSATALLQSTYDSNSWTAANRRDGLGRIVHREESVRGGASTTFDYTYSPEGRLIDVLKNGAPYEHYAYGSQNGNRTAATTPSLTVTSNQIQYDNQDRLKTYGPYSYTYTPNGELLTKTANNVSPAVVTTYAYDHFGNLLNVTRGGTVITYIVDGMNRRVGKMIGSTMVRQWLYRDGLKPVAELDGQGHLISTFVYASNSNIPDFMVRGTKTYRILTDHVGSPRLVVNVSDATDTPFQAEYTAFGEVTITGTPDFIPFGFASGLYDVDTGLLRFGARDYEPTSGRWTQKDPVLFDGDQTNLYLYAHGDPVNFLDQSGLLPNTGSSKCGNCFEDAKTRERDCEEACGRKHSPPRPASCGADDDQEMSPYYECLESCWEIHKRDTIACLKNSCSQPGNPKPPRAGQGP